MTLKNKILLLSLLEEADKNVEKIFQYEKVVDNVALTGDLQRQISKHIHSIDEKLNGLYAVALNRE